ncbi:MAG: exodeoxyribonuclease VII small subunit [Firmicutes bacterium]|nr:exodeoxyribonuclease VII small subunit [Bacillota bacterium]
MDFEKKLQELEQINQKLSSGISIEQGISLFERSLSLTKECIDYLNKAKAKISQIKQEVDYLLED